MSQTITAWPERWSSVCTEGYMWLQRYTDGWQYLALFSRSLHSCIPQSRFVTFLSLNHSFFNYSYMYFWIQRLKSRAFSFSLSSGSSTETCVSVIVLEAGNVKQGVASFLRWKFFSLEREIILQYWNYLNSDPMCMRICKYILTELNKIMK